MCVCLVSTASAVSRPVLSRTLQITEQDLMSLESVEQAGRVDERKENHPALPSA